MPISPSRPRDLVCTAAMLALLSPVAATGQWIATPQQAFAVASPRQPGAAYPAASRLINAADFQAAALFEDLWRDGPGRPDADARAFVRASAAVSRGARWPSDMQVAAPDFAKLVPELAAALDWGRDFRRAVLGLLADRGRTAAARDGEMTQLVAQYRSRTDLALSAVPKAMDLPDGQPYSLEFRQRFPRLNGLAWAARWAELAAYERLLMDSAGPGGDGQTVERRLQRMLASAPESTPFLLPIAPGVAPTFARRYPEAAAIVDNLHMLEDGIADVLVSRDVPRSAKRMELLRLRDAYRSDTAAAITVAQWMSSVEMLGANNMGGAAIGFGSELPTPTVARGASMVGMSTHDMSAMGGAEAPGTQTGAAQAAPTLEATLAILSRMMSDPVIRERVATDPMLQKMLAGVALDSTMRGMAGMSGMPGMAGTTATTTMPGMDHSNMPGMSMSPAAAVTMLKGTAEQRAQALDFVVKLLSDPAVEARIHTSAELHTLWSDPEVQKRLADLKRKPPAKPPIR